jgi:hypothetical protein
LRNRESVEAELELGGLRLLWEAFENRTGDEVERVRLTAAMAGWAATVVVMMARVGGVMGWKRNRLGRGGMEKYVRGRGGRSEESQEQGYYVRRVVNLSKHDMQAERV